MSQQPAENKMGTMPIKKLVLTMSLPMMVSMLVQALYNVVDSYFVAKLSEDALAAVGMAFPFQNLMIAVSVGTGVGINALLSRSLGAKDQESVDRAAENGVLLGLLSALVFTVAALLFAAGVLAGTGVMGYPEAMAIFLLAGCGGDAVNYLIGRHVGPAIFQRDSRFIRKKYLLEAHAFYVRHGGKAIVLARFVPIVRTFAPFVAGIALMHPHTFFLYNILGCVLWVGGLVSAGYFLGNLDFVQKHFSLIVYAIILISILPVIIGVLRARLGKGTPREDKPTEEDYMKAAASLARKDTAK